MAAIKVCHGEVGGRPAVWVLGMERERKGAGRRRRDRINRGFWGDRERTSWDERE